MMSTRFERIVLACLIVVLAVFYTATIHSFAYSAIINGEWVEMRNGTVVADDYQAVEADIGADFIDIVERAEQAETVAEEDNINTNKVTEPEHEPNAYEVIAASMTAEESELLRWVVCLECCDEPFEGQIAVVETIFNRVLSPKWTAPWGGNTVGAVLRGKGQYATIKYIGSSRAWATPNEKTDDVISECIRRGPASVLPSTKYTYFDSKGGVNGIDHIKIGHHTFGRDK